MVHSVAFAVFSGFALGWPGGGIFGGGAVAEVWRRGAFGFCCGVSNCGEGLGFESLGHCEG